MVILIVKIEDGNYEKEILLQHCQRAYYPFQPLRVEILLKRKNPAPSKQRNPVQKRNQAKKPLPMLRKMHLPMMMKICQQEEWVKKHGNDNIEDGYDKVEK